MSKTLKITPQDHDMEFGKENVMFIRFTAAKEQRETVTSDSVQVCVETDLPLHKMDLPIVRDFVEQAC
ncbi:hypothetical protein KIL84_009372 [Mauremys mutica]|uniref:Uncharacterized protein n=1 Tax=Mauremys mutica TaxID=74926 RepID=A0A9D3XIT4_9SAUR|nr:hypothetical protein KIL84_009372 [Mauremys mutica]